MGMGVSYIESMVQPDCWRLIQGGASNTIGVRPDSDLEPLKEGRGGFKPSIEFWANARDVVRDCSSLYIDV
jgi:hypothetical protein